MGSNGDRDELGINLSILSKGRMTTGVIVFTVTIMTATPAIAAGGQREDVVQNIIQTQTGRGAGLASPKEIVGSLSVTVGRDKSGKSLESYSQRDARSVKMMAVIDDESQDAVEFTLGLPGGAEVVKQANGSLLVGNFKDKGAFTTLGKIEKPWAIDADGKSLSTSYSYTGGVLTQQVDTRDATFPIVADPMLTFGFGVYLGLYGWEMNAIASAGIGVAGGATIAACIGSKLPVVVAKIVLVLCTVLGGPSVLSLVQSISSVWRSARFDLQGCYQKQIVPNLGGWVKIPAFKGCKAI